MTLILEERRIVLQFEKTALMTETYGVAEPEKLNLRVYSGDLILIRLARSEQTSTFADVCAGIIQPTTGAVYFLGKSWPELPPDQANALRGRIGRVFRTGNWMSHLSLMENILLSQQHHTRRSVRQLSDEAGKLSQQFGLPGIPLDLPGDIPAADLKRAACVRAFLGRPALILLEEPTAGIYLEIISALMNAVREARERGAAVIWLTQKNLIWNDRTLPVAHRYRLVSGKLMEVTT
jgi:phospholipid/cholesterol/gamma-HCH transport system ATP-binding protein